MQRDFFYLNRNIGADIVFKFGKKFSFEMNLRGKKGDHEKHEVCHILLQELHSCDKFFEHSLNHIRRSTHHFRIILND